MKGNKAVVLITTILCIDVVGLLMGIASPIVGLLLSQNDTFTCGNKIQMYFTISSYLNAIFKPAIF